MPLLKVATTAFAAIACSRSAGTLTNSALQLKKNKIMKKTILYTALFLFSQPLLAQTARFTSGGTIEFEKTVNTYALIKKGQVSGKNRAGNEQQLFEQYQTTHPQFKVFKSTLVFDEHRTLFTPTDRELATGMLFSIPMAAQTNTVYCDHTQGTVIAQKNLLGETFLLADSTRRISWKLTGETREIAGYPCRRANAIVMDSIYVVAFFTEKIHVPGGPESFGGLPGMILEIALPHENVTWCAVKVTGMNQPPNTIVPPKGGKAIDRKGLITVLKDVGSNQPARQAALMMKVSLL
jgi:GLPGLI family protein